MEAEIDRLRGQLRQREQEYEEVMRAMLNQDVTSSFNAPTSSASSSSVSLRETVGVTGVGTAGVGSIGVDVVGVRGGRTEQVVIPVDNEISATSSRNSRGDMFLDDINSTYDSYNSAVERNPPTSTPTDATISSSCLTLHAEPSPLSLPSTAFISPRIDTLLNNLSPLDGSLSSDEDDGEGSEGEGSAVRTLVTARGSGSESDTVGTNSSINTTNIATDNAYVDTSSGEAYFHDDYHYICHFCVFLLMPI
jgi:hypothetical protein